MFDNWKWDFKHIVGILAVVWTALTNSGVVPPLHTAASAPAAVSAPTK